MLESSPTLRTSGFAFTTWTNAFRALDALGIGDKMRRQHLQIQWYGSSHTTFNFSSSFMYVSGFYSLMIGCVSCLRLPGKLKKWISGCKGNGEIDIYHLNSRTSCNDLSLVKCRGPHEARCVKRNVVLQALEEELPRGTIRYSSKIVSIEEDGHAKILHLADGSTLRAKVTYIITSV